MKDHSSKNVFFELVRAGLWEKNIQLLPYGETDFQVVYKLAQEQSVIGVATAGLEFVTDKKIPKEVVKLFFRNVVQLEKRNKAMNGFIAVVSERMYRAGIYMLLVKGQGIAQCYGRPLWRCCGDVDFLLEGDNYCKAKEYLVPLSQSVGAEDAYCRHLEMSINRWVVELHGALRTELSFGIDRQLDDIQKEMFVNGEVRQWNNEGIMVYLPSADNDVIFIFTHFLKHFYKGGLGLRQICDWCRLLWVFKDDIDKELLEKRLKSLGLLSEWKAFGAFAVDYLGMPDGAMPFYDPSFKWSKKARHICDFVLKVGNMGHNRDMPSYGKYPYLLKKAISFGRRFGDLYRHARIFPKNSFRFVPSIMSHGIASAMKGL